MAGSNDQSGASSSPPAKVSPSKGGAVVNRSLKPQKGLLTFEAEGLETGTKSLHNSRFLHVPSGKSGLTIGRGYDMKEKKSHKIVGDLVAAGVPADAAAIISTARGMRGKEAKDFIATNKLDDFEIGSDVQVKLFDRSYAEEEKEVVRISNKKDTVAAYGKIDFKTIDPALRDLMVDLKFRGDYTPGSRKLIQKSLADNDLKAVQKIIGDEKLWPNVPLDRFKRRKDYIDQAVKNLPDVKLVEGVRK